MIDDDDDDDDDDDNDDCEDCIDDNTHTTLMALMMPNCSPGMLGNVWEWVSGRAEGDSRTPRRGKMSAKQKQELANQVYYISAAATMTLFYGVYRQAVWYESF